MVLLVLRFFLDEPEEFQRHSMKYAKTPYKLVLRFYGWRLFIVSLVWFIYDVSIAWAFHSETDQMELTFCLFSSRPTRSVSTRALSSLISSTRPKPP